MGIETVVGGLASGVGGAVVGGLLGGGDSPSGSTTSTATNEPWGAIKPYLVGGTQTRKLKAGVQPIYSNAQQSSGIGLGSPLALKYMNPLRNLNGDGSQELMNPDSDYETTGTPGIADEAARIYGSTGMSQEQRDFNRQQQVLLQAFTNNPSLNQSIWHNGAIANDGAFDTAITAASNVNPQQVDLQGARSAQGPLDPTQSMQRLLSGQPDNPYLAQMASGLTGLSNQNLQQNILPGIGQGAQAAGQYGGSRQGIAQGVAIGNAQTGLNNSIANLYGNAYQQAQQNMYGTANNVNAQAGQNAQYNAGLDMQGQQFNSNLQLQNNLQQMQQAQNNLNNRVTGSNLITGGLNAQNNLSSALNSSYDYTRNQPWDDLSKYQSVIQPLAGMGNSQSQSNPYFTNTAGNILGGASAGLGLGQKIGSMFGSSGGNQGLLGTQAGSMGGNGSVQGNSDYYWDL